MKKHNGNRRGRKPAKKRGKARGMPPAPQQAASARAGTRLSIAKLLPGGATRKAGARTAVAHGRFSGDDRLSIALMLAPFMIVAASLAGQKALRSILPSPDPVVASRIEPAALPAAPGWTVPPSHRDVTLPTAPAVPSNRPATPTRPIPASPPVETAAAIIPPVADPRSPVTPAQPPKISARPAHSGVLVKRAPLPPLSPLIDEPLPALAAAPPIALPTQVPAGAPPLPKLAMIDPALLARPPSPVVGPGTSAVLPPPRPTLPSAPDQTEVCHAKADLQARATAARMSIPQAAGDPARFGLALAAAARAQLDDLVIYNARYARIGFPNGDVSPLFGVCTDVVVRAYRALDIDLQQLVQATRSGRGDPHIDHRRVEVLRRFFEKHGQVLAITDVVEDYQPGDIVTYYRPQNRTSTAHIAIVTDQIAPSGRPMIVHNRGWGPQLEDALFVDRITGHYRFSGIAPPVTASARGNRTATVARESAAVSGRAVAASGKVASAVRRGSQTANP